MASSFAEFSDDSNNPSKNKTLMKKKSRCSTLETNSVNSNKKSINSTLTSNDYNGNISENNEKQEASQNGGALKQKISRKKQKKPTKFGGNRKVQLSDNNGHDVIISKKLYKEIRYLQATTLDMIPKLAFGRLVRECMQVYGHFKIQSEALLGLQVAAEMYMTQLFEDANRCTLHAHRKTLKPDDLTLVLGIRERYEKY